MQARRRAAMEARRRTEERRRAEARARLIRIGAILFVGVVSLILLGLIFRACRSEEDVPVLNTDEIAESGTFDAPVETDPPETEQIPSRPLQPTVTRPTAAAEAITLTTEIDSTYAALIDLTNNTVIAGKSANARMYPASMTKVMSLIVAYEAIEDLSDTFLMTSTIIDPVYRSGASLAGFSPNEPVTLLDLLYGTILPSGAEAAVALAEYVAGSEEAFVDLMNEKAKSMGLTGTHFTNCTGLHDADHYSTAVEMAMIMAYAMQYEDCAKILSTYRYTTAPTEKHPEGVALESTMFSRMYGDEPEGVTVQAGKTGYTTEGHHCLVSYATDDETGEAYIFVTANAKEKFAPIFDAIAVYSDYTD